MAKLLLKLLFLTVNLMNFNLADFDKSNSHYETISYQIQQLGSPSFINLREKRETPNSDLSIQYKSYSNIQTNVPTSGSTEAPNPENTSSSPSVVNIKSVTTEKTLTIKPTKLDDTSQSKYMLGVNGSGQRKDYLITTRPPIVSDPISPNVTKKGTTVKKVQSTKDISPVLPVDTVETMDNFFGNIDISEDEVEKTLRDKNFTLNYTEEHHVYYNSTIFVDESMVENYWDAFKNISSNNMLSTSHRRAMTVQLSFDFPFYGNPVRNVTVATGGFLYTGEFVHSWLAATQYIAPLMANFDSSLSNNSLVRYSDNGTAFTVIWENVHLQDKRDVGTFTFSTTLHKNGDIVFTYFSVPMPIEAIDDVRHPVKVGLSDAYIIDKVIFFARRKTIYEYHRVNFAGTDIQKNTIIYLKALPTCLSFTTCQSCLDHDTNFDCSWCPSFNKCSIGTDRKRQEWLQKGCDRTQIKMIEMCPAIRTKGNDSGSINSDQTNDNHSNSSSNNFISKSTDRSSRKDTSAEDIVDSKSIDTNNLAATAKKEDKSNVGLAIGLMIPVCLVMSILVWIFYAYRNPHTKSGQLLIQYRPSHWSWRRGEARYTAATIHM